MLLQFDGTLIVFAISFILFIFVMQKVFYAPIREVREDRAAYINNNIQVAQSAIEESQKLQNEYDEKIIQTRIKANNIVFKSTSEANKEKSALLEEASKKASQRVEAAREETLNQKNQVIESLKPQIISLAHSISTKVLGEEIPMSGISSDKIDQALNREKR